jgi:hypothetical protein
MFNQLAILFDPTWSQSELEMLTKLYGGKIL